MMKNKAKTSERSKHMTLSKPSSGHPVFHSVIQVMLQTVYVETSVCPFDLLIPRSGFLQLPTGLLMLYCSLHLLMMM